MAYTNTILPLDPNYLQDGSYTARDDRLPWEDFLVAGAIGGGFLVTHSSGLTLSIAAGNAWVDGQDVTSQGFYRVRMTSNASLAVAAGHATLPRLDQIILRVLDTDMDSSTFREARLEVIPGTPTSGATLGNRNGAANLTTLTDPIGKSVLLLADILVPAAAGSINSSNVGDKRNPFGLAPPYSVVAIGSAANQILVNSDGKIYFGTALDTNLYRGAANILGTDDSFYAALDVQARSGAATQVTMGSTGSGAGLVFGSSLDTNLYRSSADILATDDEFRVLRSNNTHGALAVKGGGAGLAWSVLGDGKTQWGPGDTTYDANLYRSAADTLKSDDGIWAVGGIVTKVKAGIPLDADLVAGMQQSGAMVLDTSNSRIYFRVGSTWKFAALT